VRGAQPTLSRLAGCSSVATGRPGSSCARAGRVIDCAGPVGSGRGTLKLHLDPRDHRLADGLPAPDAPPSPDLFMATLTAYQRSAALRRRAGPRSVHRDRAGASRGHRRRAMAAARLAAPHPLRLTSRWPACSTKDGERYAADRGLGRLLDRRSPSCVASAGDFVYATSCAPLRRRGGDRAPGRHRPCPRRAP